MYKVYTQVTSPNSYAFTLYILSYNFSFFRSPISLKKKVVLVVLPTNKEEYIKTSDWEVF